MVSRLARASRKKPASQAHATSSKFGDSDALLDAIFPERLGRLAKNGRLSQRIIAAVAGALRRGASREAASAMAGVSPGLLERWIREGSHAARFGPEATDESLLLADLWQAVAEADGDAEAYLVAVLHGSISKASDNDDPRAAAEIAFRILERRMPERWGGKPVPAVTVNVDASQKVATPAEVRAAMQSEFGNVGPREGAPDALSESKADVDQAAKPPTPG